MTTLSIYMDVLLVVGLGAALYLGFAWGRGAFQRHPGGFLGFIADYAVTVLPLAAALIAVDLIPGYAGLVAGAALLLLGALHPWASMARARVRRASGLQ